MVGCKRERKYTVKSLDDYIKNHPKYVESRHRKESSFTHPRGTHTTDYYTLPTYIRNCIDHPSTTAVFSPEELHTSTLLLIELCREEA